MFPLSSDTLANFRSVQGILSLLKSKIDSLSRRVGNVEIQMSALSSSSGGGTTGTTGATGPSAEQFIYAFAGSASTSTDSTQKRVVGEFYFDPTDADLGTDGSSVATFEVVIATSAGANTVNCDLLQETGAGSPAVIATVTPSASTTAVLVTADVSASFRPTTGVAAMFAVRIWLTTNTGNDYATCSMARVRLVP